MKLYVINPTTNDKIYLNLIADSRLELETLIGGSHFYLLDTLYSVSTVYAENDINNTAAGAVVGGIVGIFGGPIGIIIGSTIGGLIGNSSDSEESIKVQKFNNS